MCSIYFGTLLFLAGRKQAVETMAPKESTWKTYQPYMEMMNSRREEALRSILVEIERLGDSGGLKKFCENYGPVNKCYLYRASGRVGSSNSNLYQTPLLEWL